MSESHRDTVNDVPAAARPGVWSIMRPVRGRISVAMLLAGLGAASAVASLCMLAWAVHTLLAQPGQWPWVPLSAALALTAAATLLRMVSFNQSHFAAFRLEHILRSGLSTHLARVPMGYIDTMGAGALAKVMQDDVKALHVFVADSTPLYARAYVSPVLTFIALWLLDWPLALTASAVLLIGLAILGVVMRQSAGLVQEYNTASERVSAAIVEFVQAMPVVRTFDSGTATFGRYQQALTAYRDTVMRWYRSAAFSSRFSIAILSPMPTLAALLWIGSWFFLHERLEASTWLAVLLIGTGMAEALMPLMSLIHLINKTELSIARIHEVMSVAQMPQPAAGADRQAQDASVCFENVTFRYGSNGDDVLHELSFKVPQGSVCALVGPSGAGKTTVARLIPRFHDASAGRVLVGGTDVRDMLPHTLMNQVAFVFQDTFLFADSIADNIRLGVPEASLDDVIAAAKVAQAHAFIQNLPQGYETRAGERGVFLSGGQRQRITIARAILQNRPILVLDEATAFADPENEAALVAALSELMRGKTVIMVAHRLSTIRDADRIIVLDRGRLAESGRHDELLAAEGRYARLWRSYTQAQSWALRQSDGAGGAAAAPSAQGETA
ncbi:MAG: ABC transporter ATP-binding protein [Rhodocyclaceae bacterium]